MARKPGRPLGLTPSEQNRLCMLWNESGMSNDEIAAAFGWAARGPLQRWVERLGLERRGPYSHKYVDGLRRALNELEAQAVRETA